MTDPSLTVTWPQALQSKRFILALSFWAIALLVLAFFMPFFFGVVILHKPGPVLNDFILDRLPPTNFSWTIFTLIYSTAVLTLITNLKNPRVMLVGLASYTAVTWLRMLSIYLFTLEPPQGIITLVDPFLSLVVYPGEFSKDLFFSGHVSAMAVFVLIEPRRGLWWLKLVATVMVGLLLMVQHVHYTLDIVVAPVISVAVYLTVVKLQKASAIFK